MLYGTTGEFLDFFSLQDLRELPTLREYSELTAESRQVMSDRLGVPIEPSEPAPGEPELGEPELGEPRGTVSDVVAQAGDLAGSADSDAEPE